MKIKRHTGFRTARNVVPTDAEERDGFMPLIFAAVFVLVVGAIIWKSVSMKTEEWEAGRFDRVRESVSSRLSHAESNLAYIRLLRANGVWNTPSLDTDVGKWSKLNRILDDMHERKERGEDVSKEFETLMSQSF